MNCKRCRGTGFVMIYDDGVAGCEEYGDCPDCGKYNGYGTVDISQQQKFIQQEYKYINGSGLLCPPEMKCPMEKFDLDKSIHGEYYLNNPLPPKQIKNKRRRIIL